MLPPLRQEPHHLDAASSLRELGQGQIQVQVRMGTRNRHASPCVMYGLPKYTPFFIALGHVTCSFAVMHEPPNCACQIPACPVALWEFYVGNPANWGASPQT